MERIDLGAELLRLHLGHEIGSRASAICWMVAHRPAAHRARLQVIAPVVRLRKWRGRHNYLRASADNAEVCSEGSELSRSGSRYELAAFSQDSEALGQVELTILGTDRLLVVSTI
jgi:hypothetical protein